MALTQRGYEVREAEMAENQKRLNEMFNRETVQTLCPGLTSFECSEAVLSSPCRGNYRNCVVYRGKVS